MGNVHLVTGFAGKSHVTAADHASLFEAAFRSGQFVMNSGNNFKASLISANQVRISDGEMIMQGRFVRINPAAYEDVAIENGAQGYLRNDLIVMRYTRDADTGIESIGLVAIKGQAVAADPADPQHQVGNINDGGSLTNDFPLYRIPLDGLNVGDPVALFTPQPSIYDLYVAYKAATDKSLSQLSAEKAPVGYVNFTGAVSSHAELTALIQNTFLAIKDNSEYRLFVNFSVSDGVIPAGSWFVSVKREWESYGVVELINDSYHLYIRKYATWQEPEWVNPPMQLGVEYRTTERHDSKAVYTILANIGALPNKASSSATVPTTGAKNVIRDVITLQEISNGATFTGDHTLTRYCGVNISGTIHCQAKCSSDLSAYNGIVQVWYTKD